MVKPERCFFDYASDYSNVEWVSASIGHINANGREDEFKMLVHDIKKQEREVKDAEDALEKERPLASKSPFVYYVPNPNFKFKPDDIVVYYGYGATVHTYDHTKQVSSFSGNVCKVNRVEPDGKLNVSPIDGGEVFTARPNQCALLVQYGNQPNMRRILIYFHQDRSSRSSSKPIRSSSKPISKKNVGGKKRKRSNHTQRRRR